MTSRWRRAYVDHHALLCISAVFIVAVLGEAVYAGVPSRSLVKIFGYIAMSAMIGVVVLTFTYLGAFYYFFRHAAATRPLARWREASGRLDVAARDYLDGDRWSYACFAFLALLPNNFFFIVKSLIPVIHPYWGDPLFARLDKWAHFGHTPQEFIIPLVNNLGIAHLLDVVYVAWLILTFVFAGYNTFIDRRVHRRLQFLWTFMLSWIFLGSILATALSSVGPLFFHDFYPSIADPYAALAQNLDDIGSSSFFFMTETRQLLLGWAHNGELFNPNRISAMPSMHIAISWAWVLYTRRINKVLCAAMAVFCLLVFLSTLYFGMHYAIDAYFSILIVSLFWWVSGRIVGRRHTRSDELGFVAP